MKRFFFFITALAMCLASAEAQSPTPRKQRSNSLPVGINLSLWKGASTQRTDTVGSTALNIGLLSAMNRLNGIGANILAGVVQRDANGVQLAGIANIVGGSMRGVQLAGITNINGDNMTGVSVTGLFGLSGRNARGVMFSGLTNITGDNSSGLMASGLVNIGAGRSTGVELAGLANINAAHHDGLQIAGLANIAGDTLRGIQATTVLNVAAKEMRGAQIGLLNVAVHARGLQMGLVNYYAEGLDGFQLGLVNANPDTQIEFMATAGTSTLLNAGLRFRNRLYYTILSLGYDYHKIDRTNFAATYRAGLRVPLWGGMALSGDAGVQHVETFHRGRGTQPGHLFSLQARLNAEYQISRRTGVMLTGGYDHSRDYHGHRFHSGLFMEAGTYISLGTFGGRN